MEPAAGYDVETGSRETPSGARDVWRFCVLGLFAAVVLAGPRPHRADAARAPRPPLLHEGRLLEPAPRLSVRELRRLPGIGPVRARAIAEARFELPPGQGLRLEELRGIGPGTVAALARGLVLSDAPAEPP